MDGGASLPDVLAERDRRNARRTELAAEAVGTLVQLTICAPGSRKDGEEIRKAARMGAGLFRRALSEAGFPVLSEESREGVAGPCYLWVVDAEAALVKKAALGLEDGYSVGRLWDFDVYGPGGLKLDREAVGSAPRKCFVCGSPAAACAGRRLHEPLEVERRFAEMLEKGMEELEKRGVHQ